MSSSAEISAALEVFVHGFCAQKSATHPYEYQCFDEVWQMRDVARKNPKNYRKEEWIAYGTPAADVDALARKHTRGRFFICAVRGMDDSDEAVRTSYKQLGYRLLVTEPFFIHRLKKISKASSPATIERVTTPEMAIRFGKASRSRPISQEHLKKDAAFRQYVAIINGEIVGWVRSIDAASSTWCANMYVRPKLRRQGIGKALLAKMLRDDRARGAKQSVLLASHTGALLYPRVGYEQIGLLYIFAPRKSAR